MKRGGARSSRLPRRPALLLVAAAALAGLGAAGAGCQRGGGGREEAAVLAVVGPYRITTRDLERRIAQVDERTRSIFESPERRSQLLEMMVEEKLVRLAAEARGFDRDPDLLAGLDDVRTQLLDAVYSDQVLKPLAVPDSAEVLEYYRGHPDEFKVAERAAARQIVAGTEKEARSIRRRLMAGAPFDSLVRKSIDPSTRNLGGALGYLSRGAPVRGLGANDSFVEAVMAVPDGEISEPIRTNLGYHIVRVEAHEPERVRDLDAVKEALVRKLGPAKLETVRRRLIDSLRVANRVRVDTLAVLGDEAYRTRRAKELFDRAQATEDPAARITIYEEILARHGDTRYGAQAQFMLGFIHAEELNEPEKARTELNRLIDRYPSSELVDSARWMLENLAQKDSSLDSGGKAGP